MSLTITITNPLDQTAADLLAELNRLSADLKAAINADQQPDQPAPIVTALGLFDSARAVIQRQAATADQRAALETYARAYAERLEIQNHPAKLERIAAQARRLHIEAQQAVDAAKIAAGRAGTREIDTARKLTDLDIPNAAIMATREAISAAYELATA